MLDKWNALFIDERIAKVAKALGKRVLLDMKGVARRNKATTTAQIISTSGTKHSIEESHITPQDIATTVRSYELEKTNGLGLVFIVDRFCENSSTPANLRRPLEGRGSAPIGLHWSGGGVVHIVFFDVATREVIFAERQVHEPGGFGFRNYWFGVIKRADATLGNTGNGALQDKC